MKLFAPTAFRYPAVTGTDYPYGYQDIGNDSLARALLDAGLMVADDPSDQTDTNKRPLQLITPALAAAVAGGVASIGIANAIALIGDSRIANGEYATANDQLGYFNNLNALLGARFIWRGNFAVGGKNLDDVLATQIPQVLALNPRPAWAFMECGYNDVSGAAKTAAATIASWVAIYNALNAAGIGLIQSTSLPGSGITTVNQLTVLATYNRYLLAQNGVRRGFICFDGHSAVVDPATGQFLATLAIADVTHPSYQGAWAVAKIGFACLDPVIPKYQRFGTSPNNYTQFALNPTGNGTAGTKAGNFTGNPPTLWDGTASGAGACAATNVARTDGKTGNVTRLTFSAGGGTWADKVGLEVGRAWVKSWASNVALTALDRIRPTIATGYHYLVTTAGTSATGSDPTAGWSKVLGATVTDGTVTMTVVPSIDVGDTVQLICEIAAANYNSAVGSARLSVDFYTAAFGLISSVYGSYADDTYTTANNAGGAQVLQTKPFVVPATTGFMLAKLSINARNGAVIDVGVMEIQKVG